jgi:uroporphyrinogen-III synthase
LICVRLLVTRPEPDGERTAAALRARGHEAIVSPLLRVEAVPDADLGAGSWAGLIVTSRNAIRALAGHPRVHALFGLPVFAVGRRTAEDAREAGFADTISADGDARALVRLVLARRRAGGGPLLYLAGSDRTGDVAGALTEAGLAVETVVVYRAVMVKELPMPVRAALAAGEIDGVLHFSRRSADIYVSCARSAGMLDRALAPLQYCLSPQVADPLVAAGAEKVVIAARSEEAALLDLLRP